MLLKHRAQYLDKSGCLHLACTPTSTVSAGDPKSTAIVRLLIEAGSDINEVDQDLMTPLLLAAHHGALESARALIEAGADAMATDGSSCSVASHRWVPIGLHCH